MKKVSVCVVTYNNRSDVDACLQSVEAQTYTALDVVLIDNNSTDSTGDYLATRWPQFRLIRNPTNVGFGNAHNQGISITLGEYYMPLNPDVVLRPNFISHMVETLESADDVGWVCGKLLWGRNRGETNRLYSVGHALYRDGYTVNIGLGEVDHGQYDQLREVFGANGAAPLYRRVMLEDIQVNEGEFFDASIFLYLEDVDLDWRARLRGWRCLYTPEAVGLHHQGASGGGTNPRAVNSITGMRYYIALKHSFWLDIVTYLVPLLILQVLFLLVAEPRGRGAATVPTLVARIPRIAPSRRWLREKRRLTFRQMQAWFNWSRQQQGHQPLTISERFYAYRVRKFDVLE
jgi:GT2 family glycosyltransferase